MERTGSVLGSIFSAYLGALVKQAGSVQSSAIGSVLGSMSGSVLENELRVCLGESCKRTRERIVKLAGSVIECNWECTGKRARECA